MPNVVRYLTYPAIEHNLPLKMKGLIIFFYKLKISLINFTYHVFLTSIFTLQDRKVILKKYPGTANMPQMSYRRRLTTISTLQFV
jgi:hypothetical protein